MEGVEHPQFFTTKKYPHWKGVKNPQEEFLAPNELRMVKDKLISVNKKKKASRWFQPL